MSEIKLYQTKFCSISYDSENTILFIRWDNRSSDIGDQTFRTLSCLLTNFARRYNPEGVLFNAEGFDFTIVPATQEWHDEVIIPRYDRMKLKRFAFVTSKEFIPQLSLEQAFDEEKSKKLLEINFLEDEKSALYWLLKPECVAVQQSMQYTIKNPRYYS